MLTHSPEMCSYGLKQVSHLQVSPTERVPLTYVECQPFMSVA